MTFTMKIIKAVRTTLCSAMFAATIPVCAAIQPADLQSIRVSTTDAMTSFYMYSGLDADEKYANRLDLNLEDIYSALTRVQQGVTDDDDQALSVALTTAWNHFNTLMTENRRDIVARGYPNVRLVDDMGNACLEVVNVAETAYSAASEDMPVSSVTQLIRDLSFQMANITAQYTARGTSNLGQVFVGYHTRSPSEMADRFDSLLTNLESSVKPADQRAVANIRSKWAFLRRSLENYNENSVPFLVLNYNDSILAGLKSLSAHYE